MSPSQRLRELTREAHLHLEARPLLARLAGPAVTLADYRAYLRRFLDYYAPLEDALAAAGGWPAECPCPSRAAALAADLAALGDTTPGQPAQPRLPGYSPAHLAGVAYVLNGSTLGGLFLAAHLERRLGTAVHGATRFLRLLGDDTQAHWRTCKAGLDQRLAEPTAFAAAAAAALALFAELDAWCAADPPPCPGAPHVRP